MWTKPTSKLARLALLALPPFTRHSQFTHDSSPVSYRALSYYIAASYRLKPFKSTLAAVPSETNGACQRIGLRCKRVRSLLGNTRVFLDAIAVHQQSSLPPSSRDQYIYQFIDHLITSSMPPAVPLEPPPRYFESMPTLPPELVLHILAFASTSTALEDPNQRFKWPWTEALRERSRLLRAASLVARVWSRPAQSLLWEVLYVNPSRAQDMLDCGAPVGQFVTAEVCFEPEMTHAGRDDPVMEVLGRLVGLRTVCAFCVEEQSLPLLPYLALQSFAEIKILDLRHSDAGSSTDQKPLNLPFQLTELSLRTPTSPLVVNALLPCVANTLTHLHINLLRSPGMEPEVYTSRSLLEAVAPQLISLEVSHYTNRLGQGINLATILSSCKKLTSLHLPFDRHLDPDSRLHLAPLRAIPSTVHFLRLQDYFPLWAVTEYLGEGKSGVQQLEISPRPRPIPDSLWHLREEELALERRCGELGVRFSVADKGQQPI